MTSQRPKLPRSTSGLRIGKAVRNLKAMSMADRIQLLVKADLMSREEADQAKSRLLENKSADH